MDGEYEIRFPELLVLWQNHDLVDHGPELGDYRPEFYKGLQRRDELEVWRFIEENYLLKYRRPLVRIWFDWMAWGLWDIPFPGSVIKEVALSPDYFGMPGPLAARIRAWQDNLDSRDVGADPEKEDFDYEASDAEGLEIAGEVKLFLGDGYYVEFRPFREVAIRDGEPVELDVPRFITDLSG
jgi:hypothetical protein